MNTDIFKQKMTRKEFLLFIATFLIAISGVTQIISTVKRAGNSTTASKAKQGFGSSPYGV